MKIRTTALLIMAFLLSIGTTAFSADPPAETPADPKKQAELLDKIEQLQKQIEDLKMLKQKKLTQAMKQDQCMRAVGVENYCNCVVEKLPANIDFKQFVHIVLSTSVELGYDTMATDHKKDIDSSLVVWAKCVDYKGPKGKGGFFDNIMNRETLF